MHKPRIIICRHAESLEDVDNSIYSQISDLNIPLTEKGKEQSKALAEQLHELLKDSTLVQFFTSPGIRNIQTLDIVLPQLPENLEKVVNTEPLIVKQDWGHITLENRAEIEAERYKTGVLRYKFPTGESAESMIERLKTFKDKVFKLQADTGCDIVILSHGFEFRVFLMLVFGWSEEYFESFSNLHNAEFRILTLEGKDRYILDKPLARRGLPPTRLLA